MACVGPEGPEPSLPDVVLEDIHATLFNPEDGGAAAALSWTWPEGEGVSYFEVFQARRPDSLGEAIAKVDVGARSALVRLPDLTRPFTLYYGVRAVLVEQTGQKLYSRAVPVDSLSVLPSLEILSPESRSVRSGRILEVEVGTSSDDGVVLRQSLFEKGPAGWNRMLDTCLPMDACGIPVFGRSVQQDALILQTVEPGDTVQTLYCVHGNESFEDVRTGREQSIGCTRFIRVRP